MNVLNYEAAMAFLQELRGRAGTAVEPHLLLGNGFSINFDPARFTYGALRLEAEKRGLIGSVATAVFARLGTQDFEEVIRRLAVAAESLELLDPAKYAAEITTLRAEVDLLKEALAQVLAGLHPERPYEIDDAAYLRVRAFTDEFKNIYTANYDLLLYWALMQTLPGMAARSTDDGFRDPGHDAPYVLWDYLDPHSQRVYYLHGALHLYRGTDGLRKLTWRRTEEPLINQIRAELADDSYPLYVAEGTSADKLAQIHASDYLSKAHRSLANIGGGLLVYGLSFSNNDAHIVRAIERSKVERMAVGLYGSPAIPANQATTKAVAELQTRRTARSTRHSLDVVFFDAGSVSLW